MAKIFTDKNIAALKSAGHPMAELMELINGHTNSREYAAESLEYLAYLAKNNLDMEKKFDAKLYKSLCG